MITRIAILFLLAFTRTQAQLEEVATWTLATFDLPPNFPGGPPNGGLIFADHAQITDITGTEDKFFLAFPRFQPGQPICLGWVPRPPGGYQLARNTPINPFPDWDWHRAAAGGAQSASTNCSALVSVYSIKTDRCGRLWVLDTGVSDEDAVFTVSCPPKLLAFNTTTGEVLYRYEFPPEVVEVGSVFTNLALDDRSCSDAFCSSLGELFIYVSDSNAPGIVVYDVKNNTSWRHDPNQAYPDPDWGVFTIAGESFQSMVGIIGLALCSYPIIPPSDERDLSNIDQILYFQAYSSNRIYSVNTSALRGQPVPNEELPITLAGHVSSQTSPLVIDPKDCSILISPVHETAIARFQPADNSVTVEAFSPDLLQGVNDMYVESGQIYAVSTRTQKFALRTVNPAEVNLRIVKVLSSLHGHYYPY